MAYDLAAGVQILRAAGGEVMDLRGRPIDAVRHGGPSVAGIDANSRNAVLQILRRVVKVEGNP